MTKRNPRRQFLASISLLILILNLFCCTGGLEAKLVGEWKGSDFLFLKTEGPDLVATVNGGLDQHLHSRLILKENGTYEKFVGEYDNGKGTWKVKNDQLITTSENGNELIYTLLKVTGNELITNHEVTMDTPSGE